MATISLSPTTAVSYAAMSTTTRRTPLSNNPNVANSPLRGASALAQAKQKRSHATIQREELYGQPPPLKKQMVEHGTQRQLRSPSKITGNRTLPQRIVRPSTTLARERATTQHAPQQQQQTDASIERIRQWQNEYLSRFPKMVFYFESISEDLRAKLSKQAQSLGAREERFFSNNITHVVTTRPIPTEQETAQASLREEHQPDEQPQTINPSLLNRTTDARRRLFEPSSRRTQLQHQDDGLRRPRVARNNDILHKAKDMGKKIWPLEKFQRMLDILLQPDPYAAAQGVKGDGSTRHGLGTRRTGDEPKLSQLLQHERLNGPSDRDPTVASRELVHFKGPYIYIYDIDEKQKPIMVREYPKVGQKYEGEWPQFRTVTEGRCPFVEEVAPPADRKTRAQEKERLAKRAAEARQTPQPQDAIAAKPVIGNKRTLTEMQDGQTNAVRPGVKTMDVFQQPKPALARQADAMPQIGFTSQAAAGRQVAGEPVASGVQPSNITSAIRSQMISSATGIGAAKAGTSKEVHGLQRQVLQRGASNSQDLSSRRPEFSVDVASSRSTGTAHTRGPSLAVKLADDEESKASEPKLVRTSSKTQTTTLPQKSKRELKPGYCENCQDKFKDFDEHILSRKHRKFAENNDNWGELDDLLSQLKREPKLTTPIEESD